MKKLLLIVTILSALLNSSHIGLNHKDFKIRLKDFEWNQHLESPGDVYIKGSNFIYGRNHESTFIEISSDNGNILDTLKPYTIENERDCLILDKSSVYDNGYSLHFITVDRHRYARGTLKAFDRQYRGDDETYYLIITTLAKQEFIILFNRSQFSSISDITYFKEGKFIMTYDAEAEYEGHKYSNNVGLFDLEKIMKK